MRGRTSTFTTDDIRIQKGVFQGDTLSPTLFLAVFEHVLRYLESERDHGIAIKQEKIISLAFADDLTVVVKDARSTQRILNKLDSYARAIGLHFKPAKCISLSIKSGTTDPSRVFKLNGTDIKTLEAGPTKFLGLNIYPKNQNANSARYLQSKIEELLAKVDHLPIRGQYKLQVYERYVTACLRFDLTVCDVSQSNIDLLDRLVRKYCKKWCRMPPSAHTGFMFHSSGINIPLPSHLYRTGHASLLCSQSTDDRALGEAVALSTDSTHPPSACSSAIQNIAREAEKERDVTKLAKGVSDRLLEEHAESTQIQGGWSESLSMCDENVKWKSCLQGLSAPTFAFITRAMGESLPTNSNLCRWGKILAPHCPACGNSSQTLLHILNNCQKKLNMYAWRHDNVLLKLKCFLVSKLSNVEVLVDVASDGKSVFTDQKVETIPIDILQTSLRPDITIIDRSSHSIDIIELTIPFERNFLAAQERKCLKYACLIADLEERGFKCTFYSLELGARGVVNNGTFNLLKRVSKASRKDVKSILQDLAQCVMKCSQVIFKERDNPSANYTSII